MKFSYKAFLVATAMTAVQGFTPDLPSWDINGAQQGRTSVDPANDYSNQFNPATVSSSKPFSTSGYSTNGIYGSSPTIEEQEAAKAKAVAAAAAAASAAQQEAAPVATVAIDNATNAGLLAAQMLGTSDERIRERLRAHRQSLEDKVMAAVARTESGDLV